MKYLKRNINISTAVVILTTIVGLFSSCHTAEEIKPDYQKSIAVQPLTEENKAGKTEGIVQISQGPVHPNDVYNAILANNYDIARAHIKREHGPGKGIRKGKGEFFQNIRGASWETFVENTSKEIIRHLAQVAPSPNMIGIKPGIQQDGRLKVDAKHRFGVIGKAFRNFNDPNSVENVNHIRYVYGEDRNQPGKYLLVTCFPIYKN